LKVVLPAMARRSAVLEMLETAIVSDVEVERVYGRWEERWMR
jgi:hypothetical protein